MLLWWPKLCQDQSHFPSNLPFGELQWIQKCTCWLMANLITLQSTCKPYDNTILTFLTLLRTATQWLLNMEQSKLYKFYSIFSTKEDALVCIGLIAHVMWRILQWSEEWTLLMYSWLTLHQIHAILYQLKRGSFLYAQSIHWYKSVCLSDQSQCTGTMWFLSPMHTKGIEGNFVAQRRL